MENQKKSNREQAVWKSHETLVKHISYQFFIVIWMEKSKISHCVMYQGI